MTTQTITTKYLITNHMVNPKCNTGINTLLLGASPKPSQLYGLTSLCLLIKLLDFVINPLRNTKRL